MVAGEALIDLLKDVNRVAIHMMIDTTKIDEKNSQAMPICMQELTDLEVESQE